MIYLQVLFAFSTLNGILLVRSQTYQSNITKIVDTRGERHPAASFSGSGAESVLQQPTEEAAVYPAISSTATDSKLYLTIFQRQNRPFSASTVNKYSLHHTTMQETKRDIKGDNITIPKITSNSNDVSVSQSRLENIISSSPFPRKQINSDKIIFFKRILPNNNSSNGLNSINNTILATFDVDPKSDKTNELALTLRDKLQTIEELAEEIESRLNDCFQCILNNDTNHNNDPASTTFDYSSNSHNELTEMFNCHIFGNDGLKISCINISLYDASPYVPVATTMLDISSSPAVLLSKPLFPHITNLTSLRLHNNHHRFITKAFMGLQNLENLDLSSNDIAVIKSAFTHTPNLKSLNLSMNSIMKLGTITTALSHLKHLQNLSFDHNLQIKVIFESDLQSLKDSKLIKLDLFNTTINTVEKGAFKHLPFLEVLDLSVNYMNEEALTNVTSDFQNSSIKYLGVQMLIYISKFPYESLKFLKNTSIYRINLSNNYFSNIYKFPSIPTLKSLWLSFCSIKKIEIGAFDELPNLEELVLNNNELLTHPIINTSLNSLTTLILKNQVSRYGTAFVLPNFSFENVNNLKVLILSEVLIASELSRYALRGLNNLRVLDLSKSKISNIEDYAFETLFSLEILNFKLNHLTYLTNFTFYGLRNLTRLYLSANFLKFSQSVYPFQHSPLLKVISMQENRVATFSERLFDNNENLEILIASNNELLPWSARIFPRNTTLSILGLSGNQISYVTPTMLSEFKQVNEYLDLSKNPFNCSTCGTEEFQLFLQSSNVTLGLPLQDPEHDFLPRCAEPTILRGRSVLDADIPLMHCTEIISLVGIALIVFTMFLTTTMIYLCYLFRWYVRYWIFHVKAKIKERICDDFNKEKRYAFDAFVSYNAHDNYWISKYLIQALEYDSPSYKLCVHERDFQIGRLITENILEAIESSRHVILLLTEDFITSEWCMFELHMAQHRLFDDTRDCLILVKLKDLDKKKYTKNLLYLEKTRTCLTWTEDKTGQRLFWEKMRRALGAPGNDNICRGIRI